MVDDIVLEDKPKVKVAYTSYLSKCAAIGKKYRNWSGMFRGEMPKPFTVEVDEEPGHRSSYFIGFDRIGGVSHFLISFPEKRNQLYIEGLYPDMVGGCRLMRLQSESDKGAAVTFLWREAVCNRWQIQRYPFTTTMYCRPRNRHYTAAFNAIHASDEKRVYRGSEEGPCDKACREWMDKQI